jgi:hypothetical protein
MIIHIKHGKTTKYGYRNGIYDSLEEIYMMWYLNELSKAGIIHNVIYQPEPILLSCKEEYAWVETLKTKNKARHSIILPGVSYTYDFVFKWDKKFCKLFSNDFECNPSYKKGEKKPYFMTKNSISRIDVKGGFAPRGSNLREFEVKRKWAYKKTGMFIQKIIPEKLFQETFTPERYLFCDKLLSRKRTIKFEARSLIEFLSK